MATVFDSFTPDAAGRAVDLLVRSHMAETGEQDYAQVFHDLLPELPEALVRVYAGRGALDVQAIRRNLVGLARALARKSGRSVEDELHDLLAGEFKELAQVYYTGEVA